MRRILLLSLLLALAWPVAGARTMRDLFATEPGTVFRLLPRTVRLDMLDYYDVGQLPAMSNNMGAGSQLITADDDYVDVRTSSERHVAMRLLTAGRDTVIAVVETVNTPVPDSRLTLYDTRWIELPAKRQPTALTLDDFVRPATPQAIRDELHDAAPFSLIELSWEGDAHDRLVARHGLKAFLTADVWSRLQPHLIDSITFTTQGTRIKRVK